jgi:hypothetical protein
VCSICAILVDSGVRALAGFTGQLIFDLMTQLGRSGQPQFFAVIVIRVRTAGEYWYKGRP